MRWTTVARGVQKIIKDVDSLLDGPRFNPGPAAQLSGDAGNELLAHRLPEGEKDACTPHRLVEEIREPRDNCVDLIRMKA
jgi:hypothetical protein